MIEKLQIKPSFKPSPLGSIPVDWQVKTIGESYEICNNLRFPISEEERSKMRGEYPYYGPTKIQDYIHEYRVDGKYVLIGEDGDHFLKWKDLPMTLLVQGKFNVNNHAHIIQGNENLTEWFFYYFNHRELTPYLTRQGAGRYKLTKEALKKIPCALPPLPEQRAIAACLSTWDDAITKVQAILAQKELRKKWLMQQLLTGKKRLNGYFSDWKEFQMEDLFMHLKGQLLSKEKLDAEGSFKCILYGELFTTYKEVINEVKSKTNFKEGTPSLSGDLLMPGSTTTTGIDLTVTSAILEEGVLLGGDINIFRMKNSLTYPMFMSYFLTNTQKRNILPMTQGVTIIHIYGQNLLNLKFQIPSLQEQIAIAQVLQTANMELRLLRAKVDELKEQKKGLMQVLLTGRKRLKIND